MRILHTSDWHLGISSGPTSRVPEQELFLDWLRGQLESQEIDVLLIAGDVFDTMHPSAEAQTLYFRFLARVAETGVRDVVVIGGNHDSAARLEAPRALLETVRVHVMGGLPLADARAERMVIPLRERGSDHVRAVCLAVPYVHEYRLGIRTSDLDQQQNRAQFRERFGALYTELADAAQERFPGCPLVATGHMTLGTGSTSEDYPREIHQVGTLEGLPIDLLDPRIAYTALGHIHRAYPVSGSSARYCGSPIPYSLSEMSTPRQVLVVDLDSLPEVHKLSVPLQRELLCLEGEPNPLIDELSTLKWSTPLPPLVHIRVQSSMAEPGLPRRLHEALALHPAADRPILVEVQHRTTAAELLGENRPVIKSLDELEPEEVFGLLCDTREGLSDTDRSQLEAAYRVAAQTQGAALEALLNEIHTPLRDAESST
jgi:exonuclease SbcD